MTTLHLPRLAAVLAAIAVLGSASNTTAQEDDVFAFVPSGGRTLLETVRTEGLSNSLANTIATKNEDAGFWNELLKPAKPENPAIDALDAWQTDTLAHYLAARAPLDPGGDLPRDGRDMAMVLCQSCHIITVVVTQDRTREAWLGTLNSPSHIEITMTDTERELLAEYLVINAGIPIDQIPPVLRAGGASY